MRRLAAWGAGRQAAAEVPLKLGARRAPGLHRCALRARPGDHARGDAAARRRSKENQSAGAGRPGDRPLGAGRPVWHRPRAGREHRHRVPAEPRALRVPPLGPAGVPQLPRRAAGRGHYPPGEPGVPGQMRLPARGCHGAGGAARHAGRHRQPHHDDQRPGRGRLGRGRHRGRGPDARPAAVHARARGRGLRTRRRIAAGDYAHRPGADGDADPPRRGRGGQVCRVFRLGHGAT